MLDAMRCIVFRENSVDVTTKYMPVTEYSLTFVHEDRENTLEGKERALH